MQSRNDDSHKIKKKETADYDEVVVNAKKKNIFLFISFVDESYSEVLPCLSN
jgi:hypothetical protein